MRFLGRNLTILLGSGFLVFGFLGGCIEGPEGEQGPPGPPGPALKGSLAGRVTLFGEPDSSGITVRLVHTSRSVETDASGDFVFKNLPAGTYTLEASLAPYQAKRISDLIISGNGRYHLDSFSLKLGRRLNVLTAELKKLSPDGSRVFFLDCYVQNTGCYLYSQAVDGSSGPVLISGDVYQNSVQFAPDGSRVVYGKAWGLYSSPVDRSEQVMLDSTVYLTSYQISPDSFWVVYQRSRKYGTYLLCTVPIEGGTPLEMDPEVYSFQLTSDSQKIIYARRGGYLFWTPINQRFPTLIDNGVSAFRLTQDDLRVVYLTNSSDLKTSLIGSGPPVRIDVNVNSAQILPDSATLLYRKGNALYSSPIDQSAPLLIDSGINENAPFTATSDGSRVVYWKDVDLYSSPIRSSAPVLIDQEVDSFRITYDSSAVLYIKTNYDLYFSPLDHSAPIYLDSNVGSLLLTSDDSRVIYLNKNSELRVSPTTVSAPVLIDTMVNASPYLLTGDDARVLYYKGTTLYFRVIDASKKARAVDNGIKYLLTDPNGNFLIYTRNLATYPESQDNGIFRLDFPEGW